MATACAALCALLQRIIIGSGNRCRGAGGVVDDNRLRALLCRAAAAAHVPAARPSGRPRSAERGQRCPAGGHAFRAGDTADTAQDDRLTTARSQARPAQSLPRLPTNAIAASGRQEPTPLRPRTRRGGRRIASAPDDPAGRRECRSPTFDQTAAVSEAGRAGRHGTDDQANRRAVGRGAADTAKSRCRAGGRAISSWRK